MDSNEIAKGILKAVGILCVPVGGIWFLSALMAGASEDARVTLVLMSLLVALIAGSVICAAFRDGLAGVGVCVVGWTGLGVVCGAGFFVSVLRFHSRGPLEVPWWAWAALIFGLVLMASWCSWRREKWDQRKSDAKPMTRWQKFRAGGSELVDAVVGFGFFGVLGWIATVYLPAVPSWDAIVEWAHTSQTALEWAILLAAMAVISLGIWATSRPKSMRPGTTAPGEPMQPTTLAPAARPTEPVWADTPPSRPASSPLDIAPSRSVLPGQRHNENR